GKLKCADERQRERDGEDKIISLQFEQKKRNRTDRKKKRHIELQRGETTFCLLVSAIIFPPSRVSTTD
ncbi:hypothetical protein, partial [Enterococcus faecalis]|uniref:hypothetical protein n=1 Tax=Enterococcus faecalis TaxID=1351 RepID=UPI0022F03B8C